jgi:hypothetical protein
MAQNTGETGRMTIGPQNTLVLLVTCSRDETRRDMAVEVMQNLASELPRAGLSDDFIVFDNNSTFKDHLQYAPAGTNVIECPENVGYWSAIKWVLDNRAFLLPKTYDYIYLVESDLVHHDMHRLRDAENCLQHYPDVGCVRTQEFSVRHRWRFDKRLKFLPFHVTRSEIRLINGTTGEKAWFKSSSIPGIYLSNMHAKLPALNRLSAMDIVFKNLGAMGNFTEMDFFAAMLKLYPHCGVIDGGLFHSIFTRERQGQVSGSYTDTALLKKIGYQLTRSATIISVPQSLPIRKTAA